MERGARRGVEERRLSRGKIKREREGKSERDGGEMGTGGGRGNEKKSTEKELRESLSTETNWISVTLGSSTMCFVRISPLLRGRERRRS